MDVNQSPAPVQIDINGVPVIVAPPSWQVSVLEHLANKEFIQTPSSIEEHRTVQDNESFAYYVNRFATPDVLFLVSRPGQKVIALLDYHKDAATPSLDSHKVTRQFNFSKRFLAWKNNDKKQMTQTDFANFLEDRIRDLSTSPEADTSQAQVHTAVTQFRAVQNNAVTSAMNQANGDVEFQFTSNSQVVSLTMPTRLMLDIEIYEFGARYELGARLKYRLPKEAGQTPVFWYELIKLDEFLDAIFTEEVNALRKAVPRPDAEKVFILEG